MLTHPAGAAWRQAITTGVALALVAGAILYCKARPFDRDTLALQAGELRSQAAEAALAARLLREDALAPGFVRLHARQLARKADAVAGELDAHPAGALGAARGEAAVAAASLGEALRLAPSRGDRSEAVFEAWRARMDALQQRLKPEG